MLRLMLNGDKIIGTSAYAKVMYETCTRLSKVGYPVAHVPMGRTNQMGIQKFESNILIYPSGYDPFNEDVIVKHYMQFKADMLITIKEPWVFKRTYKQAINFVPMAIIDHSPVSAAITSRLQTAFKVIAISRFGQRELKSKDIDSVYIPHGVNREVYKPLPEHKAECKKMWFFEPDDFVVGIVAMNRSRKMVPRMLQGYKRFRELNPDVKSKLMLWSHFRPSATPELTPGVADVSVDLLPEIIELGINDYVHLPDESLIAQGIPEWTGHIYEGGFDMVKLYNSFDVLLLCSGGEGFGLPLIEGQATGCPVITTDYAAGPEQVGAGLTVPYKDYVVLNTPGTRYALPDIDKMAEALTKIYNANREKLAKKARAFTLRYDWNNIVEKYWKPFLEECACELKPCWTEGNLKAW